MLSHTPVLLDEVLLFLNPQPGDRFIDATLGAGGHTRSILERISPDGRVLAIDQDEQAIEQAKSGLQSFIDGFALSGSHSLRSSRLEIVRSNFREIAAITRAHNFLDVDGVLADIGVSSMML